MSAEILRRAASLMRENAEAADATGSWDWRAQDGATYWAEMTRSGRYIQSWHPTVALAVADLLDACANNLTPGWVVEDDLVIGPALTVARAYLGGAA